VHQDEGLTDGSIWLEVRIVNALVSNLKKGHCEGVCQSGRFIEAVDRRQGAVHMKAGLAGK
jgi:hypothetical protein